MKIKEDLTLEELFNLLDEKYPNEKYSVPKIGGHESMTVLNLDKVKEHIKQLDEQYQKMNQNTTYSVWEFGDIRISAENNYISGIREFIASEFSAGD